MKKTEVWAHRGASAYAPENTLEAFALAAEQGADGVELDVQLSRDGELVVIHDEKVDRTCGGSGYVGKYTLAELKALNCNKTKPEYAYTAIPTLKEVYELLKPTGLKINVEIKSGIVFYPGIVEKLMELEEKMDMGSRVIYSSFNHYTLAEMKLKHPSAKLGMLFSDGWLDVAGYAEKLGVSAIHPSWYHLQYPGLLTESRQKGLEVRVWTVNKEKQMRKICAYGLDAVITNYPDTARKVVDNFFASNEQGGEPEETEEEDI